ncbi:carotenoid oxygenase family protein [Geoalkalibacter halelectricus]|nr:carotenoid oxygenase family protein [Geoalkalibacter halelectricus]MDO3379840.1 carotenoid oxygenase family protein [Geoalkalibacter halelectricus]
MAGCGLVFPGCTSKQGPLSDILFTEADYQNLPVLGLATSFSEEKDYLARIEGKLPQDLRGTLYRNGPGLYERDGLRKRCLLDGDGMVQGFFFDGHSVRFRNRFVRTAKYIEESAAGKYRYSTWSTQAPGGLFTNLGGGNFSNQAGISVVVRNGRLFAFDEFHPPYEVNPETLETLGESWLGLTPESTVISAHSKIDAHNGDWIFYGLEFGRKTTVHLTVLGADGALKNHQHYELPRFAYIHDFFATERYIILNLHPIDINLWGFLLGRRSMTGAMRWAPEKGNMILVFPRDGRAQPVILEAESAWMWHSLNAFDDGRGSIKADFVGYRNPDHFLGDDPALFAIMEGRLGHYRYPGELRRYHIDLNLKALREETLDGGNFEFPTLNPSSVCHRHRFGYFARIVRDSDFFSGITRFDFETGRSETFDFGSDVFCSEPIFVAKPGTKKNDDLGWVLTQCYDGEARKSFLAVMNAQNLTEGPVATIHLEHQAPFGFHGFWAPES